MQGVAIVGMSGRFPGSKNTTELWNNLVDGKESIARFSDEEILRHGADPEQLSDPSYVRSRSVLDDSDLFDADFFGFNKRDAELTDPQHRIFLECCWETLEDAGCDPSEFEGSIGVFAGSSLNTYVLNNVLGNGGKIQQFTQGFQVDGYNILIGNDKDYLATRIAYKLNLNGPALTIQTACSTSLVAICQAATAVSSYQCDMALAGGVSITFPQERGYIYQEGAIASADGHCRAFDADAKGTVFGSGCGTVMLKRLEEAITDKDFIYATIIGSATNNDGSDKVSYTAPSVNGQSEAIALAHAMADISADSISYIEAHGTGTPLGDPIEVAGLTQAFEATTQKKGFCGLGTVKSNFGHLEAAAGVTGLIKTALSLKQRKIPASLHFKAPNPKINFENTPFYVVAELKEWEECPLPRRAGVSSFGVGGTNAHVVLEEAPPRETSDSSRKCQLFTLSARTEKSLELYSKKLAEKLANMHESNEFADAAFTLKTTRRKFDCRRIFVASDSREAISLLDTLDPKQVFTQMRQDSNPEIVFMFPGQGAQYAGMGKELYESEPLYKEIVDECCTLIEPELELNLRDLLFPEPGSESEASENLTQTVYTQPALFIVMYAQARLWMSWGIKPSAMVGHSAGEYVAATLADVMKLDDALRIIANRAREMQALPAGGMLSVRAPEETLNPLLGDHLSIAGVNSRKLTVVSGPHDKLDELCKDLEQKNIPCKQLHTSHAFHSPMMDPIIEPFRKKVSQYRLSAAKIPIVSSFTGDWINPEDWTDPDYWAKQLRGTVRFADAISTLAKNTTSILLEVGPGQTLSTLASAHPDRSKEQLCLPSMPPINNSDEQLSMIRALGRLWLAGANPNWKAFYKDEVRNRIPMPTYAFDRQRYWIDPSNVEAREAVSNMDTANRPKMRAEDLIREQLEIMKSQLDALK